MVQRAMDQNTAFVLRKKRTEVEAAVKLALAQRAAAEQTTVMEVQDPSSYITTVLKYQIQLWR